MACSVKVIDVHNIAETWYVEQYLIKALVVHWVV